MQKYCNIDKYAITNQNREKNNSKKELTVHIIRAMHDKLLRIFKTTLIEIKETIETLGKGVKYKQVNNKKNRTMSFWCFYC